MELNSRAQKVPIVNPETEETTYHYMKRFDAPSLTRYRRKLQRSATFKRGGKKIEFREVEVNLEAWAAQVEKVEGYTIDGVDVMTTDDWKKDVANLAPDHCLVALNAITAVFTESEGDPGDTDSEEGDEVPFQKKNSQDASADE